MKHFICCSALFIALAVTGCSTFGWQDVRRSKCATREECYDIARDVCAGPYQIEDIRYGGQDSRSTELGSLIDAATTAVFNPTPWTIEFVCASRAERDFR